MLKHAITKSSPFIVALDGLSLFLLGRGDQSSVEEGGTEKSKPIFDSVQFMKCYAHAQIQSVCGCIGALSVSVSVNDRCKMIKT